MSRCGTECLSILRVSPFMKTVIIGAGAAGCFCAIQLKRLCPQREVVIYEAATHPLKKVALTGGGRCNLTNTFQDISRLSQVYPRGERLMKKGLHAFNSQATCRWFEDLGIRLMVQEDQRIFPASQDAREVVTALLSALKRAGVSIQCSRRVVSISAEETGYLVRFSQGNPISAHQVIVACGGLGHSPIVFPPEVKTIPPVPSLFSFRVGDVALHSLSGTSVPFCRVSLAGTSFRSEGSILITHEGFSGPAVLCLSSYAARHLAEHADGNVLLVHWLGGISEEEAVNCLVGSWQSQARKAISSAVPEGLTSRLWRYLLQRSDIDASTLCSSLNKKQTHRLVARLVADAYPITGKSRNKEEFVTCGGISLSCLSSTTLESRHYPGLFFAGEALDIDAITGGFNLQAAWTTAWMVAHGAATASSLH